MKASNTREKSTLPGRLQIFRGIDRQGNYVADCTGLDEEDIEIPGAHGTERLLLPFRENGYYEMIPSIEKQKAFVEAQRSRFADISDYPCTLSERLGRLRLELTEAMREDRSGWQNLLRLPPELRVEIANNNSE